MLVRLLYKHLEGFHLQSPKKPHGLFPVVCHQHIVSITVQFAEYAVRFATAAPPPATAPPQSPLTPPAAGSTSDTDVLSGPTSAMPRSANADAAMGGDATPDVLSAEEADEMEFRAQQRAPLVTCTPHRQESTHRMAGPSYRARLRPRACPAAPPRHAGGL